MAIARAVDVDCKVLMLDEPTSSLDADEVAKLFEVMRTLRDHGVAIVFISHFLDQVFEISDRMTVLRNGELVGERMTKDVTELELVRLMIGRELEVLERIDREVAATEVEEVGTPVLKVVSLSRKGSLEAIDLDVFDGEVIGVAGLLGSGRTELARLLFGADTADGGELEVACQEAPVPHPASRHRQQDRVLQREPPCRRCHRGPHGRRQHAARAPGDARMAAARSLRATRTKLVDQYIEALDIRPTEPPCVDAQPERRQPAEGAAGAVADHRP